jgi:hypothetical protein
MAQTPRAIPVRNDGLRTRFRPCTTPRRSEQELREKQIELQVQFGADSSIVVGDAERLE